MHPNHRQTARRTQTVIRRLNDRCPPAVKRVICTLENAGAEVYIVGGQVRDTALNLKRGDWDLCTSFPPQRVAELFDRVNRAGETHGTIMILGKDEPVEVTTYRSESSYSDGRRPDSVRFESDIEKDLSRRDFTINAMAVSPSAAHFVDPFSGLDDLRNGLIRCVGDARRRFSEDGLRTLRGFRFLSQLNASFEARSYAAVDTAMATFAKVAVERIYVEWAKLLRGDGAGRSLALLAETKLWDAMKLPDCSGAHLDALKAWTPPKSGFAERMAAVANELGWAEDELRRVLAQFKASKADTAKVLACFAALERFRGDMSAAELRKLAAALGWDVLRSALPLWNNQERTQLARRLHAQRRVKPPLLLSELEIDGHDLMALGLKGQSIRVIFDALLEKVWENPRRNRRSYLLAKAHTLSTGLCDE